MKPPMKKDLNRLSTAIQKSSQNIKNHRAISVLQSHTRSQCPNAAALAALSASTRAERAAHWRWVLVAHVVQPPAPRVLRPRNAPYRASGLKDIPPEFPTHISHAIHHEPAKWTHNYIIKYIFIKLHNPQMSNIQKLQQPPVLSRLQ